MKHWIFLIIAAFVGASVQAAELSFDTDCAAALERSSLTQYASAACPNITVMSSCVNQNGFAFASATDYFDGIAQVEIYVSKNIGACNARCKDGDFGACYINGMAFYDGISTLANDILAGNFPSVSDRHFGFEQLAQACEGGIADACQDAGFTALSFWQPALAEIPNQVCVDGDIRCEMAQADYATIAENHWFVETPLGYYSRGCDLGSAKSCDSTARFVDGWPDHVPSDIVANDYVKRACDMGLRLSCARVK